MNPYTHLYIHGGPGFNSIAEEALLTAPLAQRNLKCFFWNEPSSLRPQGDPFKPEKAYTNLLESIRSRLKSIASPTAPISLIAHSFATHPAIRIASEMPDYIKQLVLITPSLNLLDAYKNVLRIAERDLTRLGHAEASRLGQLIGESRSLFDAPMQQAFQIAVNDPELIVNYWHNRQRMQEHLGIWAKQGLQIDGPAFFSILQELTERPAFHPKLGLPILAIYGKHDLVVRQKDEEPLARGVFSNLKTTLFEQSAHYPHIEEMERFISLLCEPITQSL